MNDRFIGLPGRAFLLCLSLAAASCGGRTGATPAAAPALQSAGPAAQATIRITIPQSAARSSARLPRYVSPATEALTLAISGPTTLNETVALTTSSGNCVSTLASTQCTLEVALAAGNYTATLTTYDGYNAQTQSATGSVLSTGQNIAFTVVSGASNLIALTLAGVPAQLITAPGAALTLPSGINAFDLVGLGVHAIHVEALDADGNTIVGAGAPTFTVSAASGGPAVIVSAPTASTPNTVLVTTPKTLTSGNATFTVTPTYSGQQTNGCAQSGANCAPLTVSVEMQQAVVVAEAGSVVGGTDALDIYSDGGSVPLTAMTAGLSDPTNVITDQSGDILAYNSATQQTAIYAPPLFHQIATIARSGGTTAMDAGGNLAIGDLNSGAIGVYAPPYTGSPAATLTIPSGMSVAALAYDANGNLWAGDQVTGAVVQFAAPITGSPAPTLHLTGVGSAVSLASVSTGDLFVGDEGDASSRVWHFTAPITSGASGVLLTTNADVPNALAVDPAGDLYVGLVDAFAYTVRLGYLAAGASGALSAQQGFTTRGTSLARLSIALSTTGAYIASPQSGYPLLAQAGLGLSSARSITAGVVLPTSVYVEP